MKSRLLADLYLPGARLIKPSQQSQQSAFATATSPDNRNELTGRYVQVDGVQHLVGSKRLADLAQANCRALKARAQICGGGMVAEADIHGSGFRIHGVPGEAGALQQPGNAIGELAQGGVYKNRDDDDIDHHELPRIHCHEADA